MTDAAPAVRISAPRLPEPARPFRFPIVATIAPVVVAVAIFAVTSSPFALLFAALGPVTAVATLIDSRWSGRRVARREAARFAADLDGVRARVDAAQSLEIATLQERTPPAAVIAARSGADPFRWKAAGSGIPVTLGTGLARSTIDLERAPATDLPGPVATQLAELEEHAGTLRDAPVVVDAALGIGVVGPAVFTESLVRALIVQVAWALPPSNYSLHATRSWDWLGELPHRVRGEPLHHATVAEFVDADGRPVAVLAQSGSEAELPGSCAVVVVAVEGRQVAIAVHPERALRRAFRPGLVSRETAVAWATQLRADAAREGLIGDVSQLPGVVPLESLWGEPSAPRDRASLACEVAVTAHGPLTLDLVRHGPHAVVGGTTGSGKSELLIAWVLSMAYNYPPEAVTFLLVDFKGGSAFGSLSSLPHTVGIITDLDEIEATRALESMRAELKYRERALADAGARSIEDAPGIPRLVIVVDEFAAMLADHPDLHALFTDIAARGRSLGVHLVLCTQRPAGVVRDAVLANADLRISLRVNNRADSLAVVPTDAAAAIESDARGRAIVAVGGDDPSLVQFAHASPVAHEVTQARWRAAVPPRRPWCAPLPTVVDPALVSSRAFGLLDLPQEQRRDEAVYEPERHGNLLVLGTQASGKSHALQALAATLGTVQRIPAQPDRAWDAMLRLIDELDGLIPPVARGGTHRRRRRPGPAILAGPSTGIRRAALPGAARGRRPGHPPRALGTAAHPGAPGCSQPRARETHAAPRVPPGVCDGGW